MQRTQRCFCPLGVPLSATQCSPLRKLGFRGLLLFVAVEFPAPDASMEAGPSLGDWKRGCDEGS